MALGKIIPVAFLLALCTIAFCDGAMFSDYYLHLYEPSQKAVIVWDEETETMLLSSAVKSDDIANFAWVVPVQSSTKPEVAEGNISVFYDLVSYFSEGRGGYMLGARQGIGALGEGGGVQVIESKEVGIYDITILKATSSDALVGWLNENDYKVPEEAKPVFEKYVAKGNYYFVANRIDMRNKFSKEIDEANAIYENGMANYTGLCDDITNKFYELGINDSRYHFDYRNLPNQSAGKDFCPSTSLYSQGSYGPLDDYLHDRLVGEFEKEGIAPAIIVSLGDGLYVKSESLIRPYLGYQDGLLHYSYGPSKSVEVGKNGKEEFVFRLKAFGDESKESGIDTPEDVLSQFDSSYKLYFNEQDAKTVREFLSEKGDGYASFKRQLDMRDSIVQNKIEPEVIAMRNKFGNELQQANEYHSLLYDYYDAGPEGPVRFIGTSNGVKPGSLADRAYIAYNYGRISNDGGYYRKKFEALYETMNELGRGVATPLKFTFKPSKPTYPLEISSMSLGSGTIEVYVLGTGPAKDSNGILKAGKDKYMNNALRDELSRELPLGGAAYATRLAYDGEMGKLSSDAEFAFEKKGSLDILMDSASEWICQLCLILPFAAIALVILGVFVLKGKLFPKKRNKR